MKILGMGLDRAGNPLFKPVEEEIFFAAIKAGMKSNAEDVKRLTRTTTEGLSFRGEIKRVTPDLGDPRAAGWTFLVNSADPQRDDLERTIEPLAKHRGMANIKEPLLFNGEPAEEWLNWLQDYYYALDLEGKQVPHYVLIVGEPDQVPFRFQSILDTVACVGRVAFDTLEDLKNYVDKLIRIESAAEPVVSKEALFFAPEAPPDPVTGERNATYYSRKYLAEPLAKNIQDELGFSLRTIVGDEATKANLRAALISGSPALVFTASHGDGELGSSLDIQKRYNGAICCQDELFMAEDVPLHQPFLEGAVFFAFACFGYGTPSESDFAHWVPGLPTKYAEADFIAALPKRLLAHPRGPIAFIGHLDTAWMHGFADTEAPEILDRWHRRIEPFKEALDQFLSVQPSGLAMADMNNRYSLYNAMIANTYDRAVRGTMTWTDELKERFVDIFITRSDAQNYMIFGDPAACLRISE